VIGWEPGANFENKNEQFVKRAAVWIVRGPGQTATCGEEKGECHPRASNGSLNRRLIDIDRISRKLDEIKFECTINSKFDLIDSMKIQKNKFSRKICFKISHPTIGKVRYSNDKRRKASMLVTLVAVREERNA